MTKLTDDKFFALVKHIARLHTDAKLLAEHKRWPSSIALSVYALEEIGKLLLVAPMFGDGIEFKLGRSSTMHNNKLDRLGKDVLFVAWTIAAADYHKVSILEMVRINVERAKKFGSYGDGLTTDVSTPNAWDSEELSPEASKALDAILAHPFALGALGIFSMQNGNEFIRMRKRALYEDIDVDEDSDLPPLDEKLAEKLIAFVQVALRSIAKFKDETIRR